MARAAEPAPEPAGPYHDVVPHDTLSEIAAERIGRPIFVPGGSLQKLLEWNPGLDPRRLIFPRQRVRLRFWAPHELPPWEAAPADLVAWPDALGPEAPAPSAEPPDGPYEVRAGAGLEPRYLSTTQNLKSLNADFNAAGLSPVGFAVSVSVRPRRLPGPEASVSLAFRSIAHLNYEFPQFRIDDAGVQAWVPKAAVGYRIRAGRNAWAGPRLTFERQPLYYLAFHANTELRLAQSFTYSVSVGLAGGFRAGPWDFEGHARYLIPVATPDANAVVISEIRAARLELQGERMFGGGRFGVRGGLAGEWRAAELDTSPDLWSQREASLIVQAALLLKIR